MDMRDWLIKSNKTKGRSATDTAAERPSKKLKTDSSKHADINSMDDQSDLKPKAKTSANCRQMPEQSVEDETKTVESQTAEQDPTDNDQAPENSPSASENTEDNTNGHNSKETNSTEEQHNTTSTNPQSPTSTPTLQIIEQISDIFTAPANTLIIHACNCRGSWGGGIAAAFRKHYPNAYKHYHAHCEKHGDKLMGTAQLIPPVETAPGKSKHFVGCLYTSRRFGKMKDTPAKILEATGPAMRDLLGKVKEWNEGHGEDERVGEVRMCLINSGLFAVEWSKTKAVLEGLSVEEFDVKTITAMGRG